MPSLRRRRGARDGEPGRPPAVPWSLRELLRDGPAPLEPRAPEAGDPLDIALVLSAAHETPAQAGLPSELLAAIEAAGAAVRVVAEEDVADVAADVLLAAGWLAAPAVLTLPGVRARAVLPTADAPPLEELGWTAGVPVLGPAWLGGTLPPAADRAYAPMPVHRREDLVLVHGEDVLGLLAVAELRERRPDLAVAVSGGDLALPFPFLDVEPSPEALAHAFASAAVAFAPPVRGWRPAAVAMLACGQPVVARGDAAAHATLGEAVAFAGSPAQAADVAERLMDDWTLRAERVRAGLALVSGGWSGVGEQLVAQLRAFG
jgi:hypothetical protein